MAKPKVMVAIRDPESVESLVKLGCEMAAAMGADLTALHVLEVGPGLPLDADGSLERTGREILVRAQEAANKHGMPINALLVRARQAGPRIVVGAEDYRIDLLILGYHGSHGPGEILL